MGEKIDAKKLLKKAARSTRDAVISVNVADMEMIQAALKAAADAKRPIFIAVSERSLSYATPLTFAAMADAIAKPLKVQYVLHLDHATKLVSVKEALDAGFNSVMFDGSFYNYESNLNVVRHVVSLCAPYGAAVEAEVGHVGGQDIVGEIPSSKTDPEQARRFVEESGIDSLAVSIGNVHGRISEAPKLDFELLEKINKAVKTPLVLHGTSWLPKDDIKRCVRLGISKLNLNNAIRGVFVGAIRNKLSEDTDTLDPREAIGPGRDAFYQAIIEAFKTFD